MDELKSKYDNIIIKRKKVIDEINALENDKKNKRYFDLCAKDKELKKQQKNLYKEFKNSEYSSCNHICVNTLHDYDRLEGRSFDYCGCIKCGLDERVYYKVDNQFNPDYLSFEEKVMYEYLNNHYDTKGKNTYLLCDLDLARAIYNKIKEYHPDINDETTIKYFETALHKIRHIKVNDKRKENRAKRLSLQPNFNKWKSWGVIK